MDTSFVVGNVLSAVWHIFDRCFNTVSFHITAWCFQNTPVIRILLGIEELQLRTLVKNDFGPGHPKLYQKSMYSFVAVALVPIMKEPGVFGGQSVAEVSEITPTRLCDDGQYD